jgi:formamidopyrimidine-DNA glycosylase
MPELPEVEVTAQQLRTRIAGATLVAVRFSGKRLRHAFPRQALDGLCGQVVLGIGRRAKYLLLEFEAGWIAVHLGMSGTLQACHPDTPARPHDHVRIRCRLSDASMHDVVFHDPRRFGSFQWIRRSDVTAATSLGDWLGDSARGIEPFDPAFNGDWLYRQSRGKTTPIKQWLMSGQTVVGVGNIYACEALFAAGIHPGRAARAISKVRYGRLAVAIQQILTDAIAAGGSTISDFLGADGKAGRYGQSHRVYGRENDVCPRCEATGRTNATIHRMAQQQRSTFYCRVCQR